MYHIEKNIPMPPKREVGVKYPFSAMDVGDSFFVPVSPGDSKEKLQARIHSAQKKNKTIGGRRFTVRQSEGGVRCWRTE